MNRADSLPEPRVISAPVAWSPRRLTLFAIYFFTNFAGVLLVFHFVHSIFQMARQEERGYDAVDGMTFFCNAFPVLLFCCFVNALWGIKALIDIFKRRDYHAFLALGIVLAVWAKDLLAMRLAS